MSTVQNTKLLYSNIMKALHPFMPFITEEIWHQIDTQKVDCCIADFPKSDNQEKYVHTQIMDKIKNLITDTRNQRNKMALKKSEKITLVYSDTSEIIKHDAAINIVKHLAGVEKLELYDDALHRQSLPFLSGTDKYFVVANLKLDIKEEKKKIEEEIKRLEGFLKGIEKKLSNERFVSNAPKEVVAKEIKKQDDTKARLAILSENLKRLG